jgi:predicted AAA+ superfamily ATPase
MTVEKYLNYLIQTYLIFSVSRFSFKAKERSRSPRKAYAVDLGMLKAVY